MSELGKEYSQIYGEYSKTVRTWFVAYGIGAPVIFLTSKDLAAALKASAYSQAIAACFLIGVCLQVILAVANKVSMWSLYYGETQTTFKETVRYKITFWFSEQYWIEFLVDLGTMFIFSLGTWLTLGVVL